MIARDSVWAQWRAWWRSVSVVVWVCVQERFQPRRTWHTHSNACQEATHAWDRESARPWHTERGEATSSSRDGSVPPCHMSVTISLSHVSLSPFTPACLLPFLMIGYVKLIICVSNEHTITSVQICLLRDVVLVKWQLSVSSFYIPKVYDRKLSCRITSFHIV